MITIQYLEDAPELPDLETKVVIQKLRAASERLAFTHLLIGWHLPRRLLEACREESERLGVRFLRWHPLLTGDAVFQPRSEWQVVGATGGNVRGFHDMPKFTFACPNRTEVQQAIQERLAELLREGLYQGFFLDRVRFPSPAADLSNDLGCFCEACHRRAADYGLNLEQVRRILLQIAEQPQGLAVLVQAMLGNRNIPFEDATAEALRSFFAFRLQSVTDFIAKLSRQLRTADMEIGLDCFSPCLTRMVGQDLGALGKQADWIKVMSYAHTLGPAGLPFELLGIIDYLVHSTGSPEAEILETLSGTLGLPLPPTRYLLEQEGLSSWALGKELQRGRIASQIPILAGVELVEIKGVARLNDAQIAADLTAIKHSGAAGLAISWDLRHIPLERLELSNRIYLRNIETR